MSEPKARPFSTTIAAHAGERIEVSILLDNGGFESTPVSVTAHFERHDHGAYIDVVATATPFAGGKSKMGPLVVNSATGMPITLQVVPRTTRLLSGYLKGCSTPRLIRRLPDGVTEGGVDVGDIGGFKARDKCHGGEFIRFLGFDALVG